MHPVMETLLALKLAVQETINSFQKNCAHENKTEEHKGSTGNYDRSADCYWIEYTCPECGKFWTEDQ